MTDTKEAGKSLFMLFFLSGCIVTHWYGMTTMAKVLCKNHFQFPRFEIPRFEKPRFETGHFETSPLKSTRIGPYSKFQKHIHDGSC